MPIVSYVLCSDSHLRKTWSTYICPCYFCIGGSHMPFELWGYQWTARSRFLHPSEGPRSLHLLEYHLWSESSFETKFAVGKLNTEGLQLTLLPNAPFISAAYAKVGRAIVLIGHTTTRDISRITIRGNIYSIKLQLCIKWRQIISSTN